MAILLFSLTIFLLELLFPMSRWVIGEGNVSFWFDMWSGEPIPFQLIDEIPEEATVFQVFHSPDAVTWVQNNLPNAWNAMQSIFFSSIPDQLVFSASISVFILRSIGNFYSLMVLL